MINKICIYHVNKDKRNKKDDGTKIHLLRLSNAQVFILSNQLKIVVIKHKTPQRFSKEFQSKILYSMKANHILQITLQCGGKNIILTFSFSSFSFVCLYSFVVLPPILLHHHHYHLLKTHHPQTHPNLLLIKPIKPNSIIINNN